MRPIITWLLIASNLFAWFAVASFFHLPPAATQSSELLLQAGAVNGELLRAGEWWRVLTSQFLHVYFAHLILNMLFLFLLGGIWERELGSFRFALLYLGSGAAGQIASVLAAPALVTSGASQALMGLAGCALVRTLRLRKETSARIIIPLGVISVQATIDLIAAHTIKAGHAAGFCAGAILGYILEGRDKA
ncbi:MAG: rhomboid family intramembrane serine protease [Acidobacteriota bacterium]|nr:rhomboid family intramembrane serine protease [Acidobacteriota bacterium]